MKIEPVELTNVIADIYDAAIDPALWQRALGSICAFVGGASAVLYWHDSATQRSQMLHIFNENPEYTRLYFEKYLPMNPMFPAATFVEVGAVHTDNDIMPRAELEKTRFYKEWIAPQGIASALAVNLEKGILRSSMINIRTDASYGPADDESRRRLALLVPHLQRAVAIGRLFDQNKAAEAALTETLGHVEAAVLLVSADGTIVFANAPAAAMLTEGKIIQRRDDRLRVGSTGADRILREIFTDAENGDSSIGARGVAVALSDTEVRWFAHVLPLTSGRRQGDGATYAAVAAVFVRDTAPNAPAPLEAIAKLHKLTATEARVLDAMLKVNGVKAIADLLGLSQATVKTHLHNLFRKTGTSRQSQLVKLVAGLN